MHLLVILCYNYLFDIFPSKFGIRYVSMDLCMYDLHEVEECLDLLYEFINFIQFRIIILANQDKPFGAAVSSLTYSSVCSNCKRLFYGDLPLLLCL